MLSDSARARRNAWKLWGVLALTGTLAVVLAWLLWGFRWPPTAAVALESKPGHTASSVGD